MTASTSGISLRMSSLYRCARHPVTIRAFSCPEVRRSASSRMLSILSFFASLIKQHVLITAASANYTSSVISYPARVRSPSISSESTRFLSQPREINRIIIHITMSNRRMRGYCSCSTAAPHRILLLQYRRCCPYKGFAGQRRCSHTSRASGDKESRQDLILCPHRTHRHTLLQLPLRSFPLPDIPQLSLQQTRHPARR